MFYSTFIYFSDTVRLKKIKPHNLHFHHIVAESCQQTEKSADGRVF